jgi:ribosome-associated translation inhibitor RaiA
MKIDIRTRGFRPTAALSAHVEREVTRSLSRVRHRPAAILASLSDLNGPRGGEDKRCQIRGCLAQTGEVVASAAGADMYRAIGMAADRFRRALVRKGGPRTVRRAEGRGKGRT